MKFDESLIGLGKHPHGVCLWTKRAILFSSVQEKALRSDKSQPVSRCLVSLLDLYQPQSKCLLNFRKPVFFPPLFFVLISPVGHSFQAHANTTVQLLITYFTLGLCVCVKKKKWKMAFEGAPANGLLVLYTQQHGLTCCATLKKKKPFRIYWLNFTRCWLILIKSLKTWCDVQICKREGLNEVKWRPAKCEPHRHRVDAIGGGSV